VRVDAQHLPNAIRVHSKVISGGLPEGTEAFAELQRLGIKTVISVDGAKPDAALAKQFGMRYIHLPHGYNGVPEDRSQELAKAVLEQPGPIYIHCHHGKHRSPAAAAVACVGAGFIRSAEARSILEFAGTNPNYLGLFHSAEAAQPADRQKLAGLAVEFREAVEIPPLVESMVELDELFEEVAEAKKAGWQANPELPHEKILHDILLLREHFTEMLRAPNAPVGSEDFVKDPDYQALLVESETTARELEALLNVTAQTADAAAIPKLDQLFLKIEQSCKTCHHQFRDKPLSRISQ
jgi:protein tyrosine phosphatase (PTP) superfamily phosphohydrolase (DUF442 family)